MTENDKIVGDDSPLSKPLGEENGGGIAVLPKTDKRPLAIVGMEGSNVEHLKTLSERLGALGMEHVVLTLEEAELEGITKEDLLSAQLEQKQVNNLVTPNRIFGGSSGTKLKKGGGSKAQQKFKRKKKGKKTHRKKKKKR